MTIAEILNIIIAMIAHTDLSITGPYGVYVTDKQIHCQQIYHAKTGDRLIFKYHISHVRHGLTSLQWNLLEEKLRHLQKEGLL